MHSEEKNPGQQKSSDDMEYQLPLIHQTYVRIILYTTNNHEVKAHKSYVVYTGTGVPKHPNAQYHHFEILGEARRYPIDMLRPKEKHKRPSVNVWVSFKEWPTALFPQGSKIQAVTFKLLTHEGEVQEIPRQDTPQDSALRTQG